MNRRHIILIGGLTLLSMFLLTLGWEFALDGYIKSPFADFYERDSVWERVDYIGTSMVFATIAVVISSLVSFKLIAGRKEVEEQNRRLAIAIESLSELFALYDREDRMVLCNREYREINRRVAETILPGRIFEDHLRAALANGLYPETAGREEEWFAERMERHRNPKGPFELARQGGRWLLIHEQKLPDGGTATICADITKQKKAEAALMESEERHRNFTADAAHELRTPLAVLRSNLDSLDDSDAAQSLRHDVDAMSRMVEQLLAYTRLEHIDGQSMRETNITDICTKVASYMAPIAVKEKRSVEVLSSGKPVTIRANPDAIEQAVRNLVENAIRYSARETVVTIRVDDDASIMVIDRGRPIPPEKKGKIFQRFLRADRRTGGAGLGLSIVQRVTAAHGGTVQVRDTPEGGTTFVLRLSNARPAGRKKTRDEAGAAAST